MELQHNITFRKKDKGWQYIISYKLEKIGKWKQKAKQGFKTKQEAKLASDRAVSILKKELKNTNYFSDNTNDITFYDLYQQYKKDNYIYFTGATMETLKNTMNSFKELWEIKVASIKPHHLQSIVDGLYTTGYKVSSIKSKMTYLNMVLNSAVKKYKIINENPAKEIKLKKDKTEVSRRALEDTECEKLLSALKSDKEIYYIVALTITTTGMRIGEVLGLTKEDIIYEHKQISVTKQYKNLGNGIWGLGVLKSKNSNRLIPTPTSTLDLLIKYIEHNTPASDGRIFNVGKTKSFQSSLNRRIKNLGFNVCLHELRHTYATKLIASNVDFKTAAYILGHDVEQTMKTYTHVTDSMLKKAKNIIEIKF